MSVCVCISSCALLRKQHVCWTYSEDHCGYSHLSIVRKTAPNDRHTLHAIDRDPLKLMIHAPSRPVSDQGQPQRLNVRVDSLDTLEDASAALLPLSPYGRG